MTAKKVYWATCSSLQVFSSISFLVKNMFFPKAFSWVMWLRFMSFRRWVWLHCLYFHGGCECKSIQSSSGVFQKITHKNLMKNGGLGINPAVLVFRNRCVVIDILETIGERKQVFLNDDGLGWWDWLEATLDQFF